jgi:hypothetical protein
MENHPNYLEYLCKNGGWFKVRTNIYEPLLLGYVSKVSIGSIGTFGHVFDCPLLFSYPLNQLYVDTNCAFLEKTNLLEKPTIEDIELIKSKLNKEHKKFNIKTKKTLKYESN